MSILVGHTTRAVGTVLTASIYNADHLNHITNATQLNVDKMEGTPPPVVDGHAVVWDGVAGNQLRTAGFYPASTGGQIFIGEIGVSAGTPAFSVNETDAAADNRLWLVRASATKFEALVSNDVRSAEDTWLRVSRSGAVATTVDFVSASASELLRAGFVVWDQDNVGARLNALTEELSPDFAADFLLMYDTSGALPKKVKPSSLQPPSDYILGTETSLSGSEKIISGIPAGVRRVTVMVDNAVLSGSAVFEARIGDSGGIEATGYAGSSATGLVFAGGNDANVFAGGLSWNLQDAANTWVGFGGTSLSTGTTQAVAGSKQLSGTLDRISISRSSGAGTIASGSINISYEL